MWIHIEPDTSASSGASGGRLATRCEQLDRERPDRVWVPVARARAETSWPTGTASSRSEHADEATEPAGTRPSSAAEAFERGVARVVPLDDGRELLVEPIVAAPRLIVAGGGHVALALARMAQLLDYDVTVIDDREEFAECRRGSRRRRDPGRDRPDPHAPDPGWNRFIVVATRGHKLDADCLRAAVKTRARYVGLLGSQRKTVLIAKMLREEGVGEDRLRAVHAPIGLDLGGRTPAEIAAVGAG